MNNVSSNQQGFGFYPSMNTIESQNVQQHYQNNVQRIDNAVQQVPQYGDQQYAVQNYYNNQLPNNSVNITPQQQNANISVAPQPKINTSNIGIALDKLKLVRKELNNELDEKSNIIDVMLCCILSKQHVLLLGPPGSGKSFAINSVMKKITGSNLFSYLLNKYTDPSEILGPFSIKQMENEKYIRVTTGKLPDSNFAFIDEIYKCNDATLNALLSILNERVFYNDGKAVSVPLISMFSASNELPEDEVLKALHDRILFRCYVDYIKRSNNRLKMHKSFLGTGKKNNTNTMLNLDDIECLQEAVQKVVISDDMIIEFDKLIKELSSTEKLLIKVSDRRSNLCLRAIQAHAVLEGKSVADEDDFIILKDILWEEESQIRPLEKFIKSKCDPYSDLIIDYTEKLKTDVNEIIKLFDGSIDESAGYSDYGVPLKLSAIIPGDICMNISEKICDMNNIISEIEKKKDTIPSSKSNIIAKFSDLITTYTNIVKNINKLIIDI